jgi:hypothetical protein
MMRWSLRVVYANATRPQRREAPPAMAAGISKTLWEMKDLAEMVDAAAPKSGRRGPYNKKTADQISN